MIGPCDCVARCASVPRVFMAIIIGKSDSPFLTSAACAFSCRFSAATRSSADATSARSRRHSCAPRVLLWLPSRSFSACLTAASTCCLTFALIVECCPTLSHSACGTSFVSTHPSLMQLAQYWFLFGRLQQGQFSMVPVFSDGALPLASLFVSNGNWRKKDRRRRR